MTQDDAGSAPMLGSQEPIAWAVFEADGNCVGTYAKQEHAQIVIEELAYDGMVYEPLYRQPGPTLTTEERQAIEYYAEFSAAKPPNSKAILLGLLMRLN